MRGPVEVITTPETIVIKATVEDTQFSYTYTLVAPDSTVSQPDWGARDRLKAARAAERARIRALKLRDERARWRR